LAHDRAFKKLDLLVATAGSQGIRLVLPLINYEPDILGMQYVVERLHPGAPKELFYADEQVPPIAQRTWWARAAGSAS
jgi:hypothetical protein